MFGVWFKSDAGLQLCAWPLGGQLVGANVTPISGILEPVSDQQLCGCLVSNVNSDAANRM